MKFSFSFKHLALLLCLMALLLGTSACKDGKSDTPPTQPPTEETETTTKTSSDAPTEEPPSNAPLTLIRADGTSNYKIYYPNGFATSSKEILRSFAAALQEKAGGKKMPVYKLTETADSDFEITVNVSGHRADAAASYYATPLTDYTLTTNGNRIIITAFSNEALQHLLDRILNALTEDSAGNWVLDKETLPCSGRLIATEAVEDEALLERYLDEIRALPHFETTAGALQPLYSLSKNAYQFAVTNATEEEYHAYLTKLEALGYTVYSANSLSAGSRSEAENLYTTYQKDNIHLFASWQGNLKVARFAFSLPAPLPSLTPVANAAKINPTVAQMQLHEGGTKGGTGMSYVVQLSDGRFILVDGGISNRFSCDVLMAYLKQQAAKAGMDTPVIAMWIFSHPDDDHIGQARARFLQAASENRIEIESFAYNFADDEKNVPFEDNSGYIISLEVSIRRFYPNATVYTPHAGQIYYFSGMQLEILTTEEDVYPLETVISHNDACITWRLNFESGSSVLFLGDNHPAINAQLSKIYGDYLKSDVLQMAHHGLSGAEITSYRNIDPDICLWPTTEARFSGYYDGNMDGVIDDAQWCIGYAYQEGDTPGKPTKVICEANVWIRDDSIKVRDHYHASQTTVLDMTNLSAPPAILVTPQYD